MKILFIENRFKTRFWEKIADCMNESAVVESHWLVQNKIFSPKRNNVYLIPYPKSSDLTVCQGQEFSELALKDRGNYKFNNGGKHYRYYQNIIEELIYKIKPDLVVGESTLFHELICIDICKKNSILYVNPSSCRYPTGRFSFYEYDSLNVYQTKEAIIQNKDFELASSIIKREKQPDYMVKAKPTNIYFAKKVKLTLNKLYSLVSWIFGERYNTPSPLKKIKSDFNVHCNRKIWDRDLAISSFSGIDWSKTVLYPLQMQPEANIDVWGYPYNNQVTNLKRLLSILPKDHKVLVKPNPKSKYEISDQLIALIQNQENIICLSHQIDMKDIFSKFEWVYTVTGTIAIEAILDDKKLITEGNSQYLHYPNVYVLNEYGIEMTDIKYKKEQLIAFLRENSSEGIVSDPISDEKCMTSSNISNLARSFVEVFNIGIK